MKEITNQLFEIFKQPTFIIIEILIVIVILYIIIKSVKRKKK